MRGWQGFASDQSGATAIEYGLIASLIFLAIITAVSFFTSQAGSMYSYIGNHFQGS